MVFHQIIAGFHAMFDLLGIPGNLLVIGTIVLERRFHVMRHALLASLAVSDVLYLILVNLFRVASIARETWPFGQTMCFLNAGSFRYFYINTVLHMLVISYDRYKAIVKSPLMYHGTITTSRVLFIFLIWVLPIPVSIAPFVGYGMYVYNPKVFFCENGWLVPSDVPASNKAFFTLALFVVPLLVIVYLNWSVYKTAKTQIHASEDQVGNLDGSSGTRQQEVTKRRRERKAAVDVSIIVVAFVLCYLPSWVVSFCRQYATSTDVPSEVILTTSCIFICSSLCNPIICSIRKRDFRAGVKKVLRRIGVFACYDGISDNNGIQYINNLSNGSNIQ